MRPGSIKVVVVVGNTGEWVLPLFLRLKEKMLWAMEEALEVRGFGVPHRRRSLRGSGGLPRSLRLLRTEDRESDRWLSGDVVQFATPPLSSSSPTAELTTTLVSPPPCSFSSARWPDPIRFFRNEM